MKETIGSKSIVPKSCARQNTSRVHAKTCESQDLQEHFSSTVEAQPHPHRSTVNHHSTSSIFTEQIGNHKKNDMCFIKTIKTFIQFIYF